MSLWAALTFIFATETAFANAVCSIKDEAETIAALSYQIRTRTHLLLLEHDRQRAVLTDATGKRYRGYVGLNGDEVIVNDTVAYGISTQSVEVSDVFDVKSMADYVDEYLKAVGNERIVAKLKNDEGGRVVQHVGSVESRQGDELNIRLSDGSNMLVTVNKNDLVDIHLSRRTPTQNYDVMKAAYKRGNGNTWVHVRLDNGNEFDVNVTSLPAVQSNVPSIYQKTDGSLHPLTLEGIHSAYLVPAPRRLIGAQPMDAPSIPMASNWVFEHRAYSLDDNYPVPSQQVIKAILEDVLQRKPQVTVVYRNNIGQLVRARGYPDSFGGKIMLSPTSTTKMKNAMDVITFDPQKTVTIVEGDVLPAGVTEKITHELIIKKEDGTISFYHGDEVSYLDPKSGERILGKLVLQSGEDGKPVPMVRFGEVKSSAPNRRGVVTTGVEHQGHNVVKLTNSDYANLREPDISHVKPDEIGELINGKRAPAPRLKTAVASGEINVRRDLANIELNKGQPFQGLSGVETYVIIPQAVVKRNGRPAILKAQLQLPGGKMELLTIDLDALAKHYQVSYADLATRTPRELAFLDMAIRKGWFTNEDVAQLRDVLKKLPCVGGGG